MTFKDQLFFRTPLNIYSEQIVSFNKLANMKENICIRMLMIPSFKCFGKKIWEVFYSLMKNLNKTARTFLLGHIIICLTLNVIFLRDFASRYLGLWVLELKLNLELFWFHLLSGLVLKVSVLRVPVFRVLVIKVLVFSVPAPGFRLSRIIEIFKI